jgi:glutamate-ammonia-ligase adenylyltransferase
MEVADHAWRRACQDAGLFIKIDDMVERIRRERGSGSDFLDLKTGKGGIIEAEFLVQALQMRANIREPNWECAVDRLCGHGNLDKADAAKLKSCYAFLRRCELVLRRYDNKGVSALPGDQGEQRKFTIRLGYPEPDAFRREYLDARDMIHTLYERRIKSRNAPEH